MTSHDLSFSRQLTETLLRARRPFPTPPTTFLPGGSRSATALSEAAHTWRARCDAATRAMDQHLEHLAHFSRTLTHQDQATARELGAFR